MPGTLNQTMNKLRWGILGAARIAGKNWKAIRRSGNATITAVASRDPNRARSFVAHCQKFEPFERTPDIFDNYEHLILSPNVDAVYIPLPTALRKEWIIRAARAGKHVLSEKPCAASVTDLEDILAACAKYKVQFMDGVMFMHNRRLQQLREMLDDAASVGALKRITSQFSFLGAEDFLQRNIRANGALEPLGCLGDLGWYCIRFALWAMKWQRPVEVSGRLLSQTAESPGAPAVPTAFSGELVFAEGVSADFHCSFTAEHHQWAMLTGTKGYVRIPDFVLPFNGSGLAFEVNQVKSSIEGCDWRLEHGVRSFSFAESGDNPATTQEANMFRHFSKQVLSRHLNEDWPRMALLTQQVANACLDAAITKRSVQLSG
jgi:predicted dehydrogenase